MADNSKQIQLKGRVIITFDIETATGLHIGGSESGIEIGGVDKTVVRDKLTNRPYIPGSSLRGKMRSLLEKYHGLPQNQRIGQGFIHSCDGPVDYAKCPVCRTFGVPGERKFATPTRLIVRDVPLTDESAQALEETARTDLPYTEVKTEVSIDRVTSAANPRQMERVPAGSIFGPAELVYSIYDGDGCDAQQDIENLKTVFEGLRLLEDDYLGGLGSRGSGKVVLKGIKVTVKKDPLEAATPATEYADLAELATDYDALEEKIRQALA